MLNLQYSKLKSIKFVIFRTVSNFSPPASLSDSGEKVNLSQICQFRSVPNSQYLQYLQYLL